MAVYASVLATGSPSQQQRRGDVDIAPIAAMFADPSRARVLTALADGRALPASRLAAEAGLSPQGVSSHLAKLRATGLVEVERSGRNRYYRLTGSAVADVIEALARLAPTRPIRSLREGTRAQALRAGRTCYDHLAGRLGTAVTQALLDRGALATTDGGTTTRRRDGDPLSAQLASHPYVIGPRAQPVLAALGVDIDALRADRSTRRPLLRFCLDWTEQRHHLAGRLGAALAGALFDAGWLTRARQPQRAVRLTDPGRRVGGAAAAADRDRPGVLPPGERHSCGGPHGPWRPGQADQRYCLGRWLLDGPLRVSICSWGRRRAPGAVRGWSVPCGRPSAPGGWRPVPGCPLPGAWPATWACPAAQ